MKYIQIARIRQCPLTQYVHIRGKDVAIERRRQRPVEVNSSPYSRTHAPRIAPLKSAFAWAQFSCPKSPSRRRRSLSGLYSAHCAPVTASVGGVGLRKTQRRRARKLRYRSKSFLTWSVSLCWKRNMKRSDLLRVTWTSIIINLSQHVVTTVIVVCILKASTESLSCPANSETKLIGPGVAIRSRPETSRPI